MGVRLGGTRKGSFKGTYGKSLPLPFPLPFTFVCYLEEFVTGCPREVLRVDHLEVEP